MISLPKIDRLDRTCRTLHGICSIDFDATLSTMLSLRPAIHANCCRSYHKYEPLSSSCRGNFSRTTTNFPRLSHSTWTGSFRGRCAGQNHVIESVLGSSRSLYSVFDYHPGSGSSCSAHASTLFLAKSLDSFIHSSCRLQCLYTPSQELRFCLPLSLQSSAASPTPLCNHYLRTPRLPDSPQSSSTL